MSDEYNDGFEAGYAYAKKEFEKERERMIKAVDESVGIGVVLFKIRRDEYRKCTMPVISSHRAIAIIRGEEME